MKFTTLSGGALLIVAMAAPSYAQTEDPQIPGLAMPSTVLPSSSTVGETSGDQTAQMPLVSEGSGRAASPKEQSANRMFGVIPNYSTVEHPTEIDPIGAGLKFKMASLNTFDPYVYPFVGFQATLNHTYGYGGSAYLKQYMTSLSDNAIGNFLTSAALPSLLHQDPRYFERGTGGFLGRVAYAASRSLITRSDSGHAQFNLSEIGGNGIAAGLSNAYYPAADRTVTGTLTRWGMQVMWDTLSNELKEFWPDVRHKLHRAS